MATKFTTHNQGSISTSGTGFRTEISISYDSLVKLFGKPEREDDGKTDINWVIQFSKDSVARIYYNCHESGRRASAKHLKGVSIWRVGGKGDCVEMLTKLFTETATTFSVVEDEEDEF